PSTAARPTAPTSCSSTASCSARPIRRPGRARASTARQAGISKRLSSAKRPGRRRRNPISSRIIRGLRMGFRRRAGWLVIVFLLAVPAAARAQSFGFPWWRDAQFQKDLNLTADQSGRIDSVFQSSIPQLRQKREELDQQESELSRLIAANAEEAVVVRQVDKVEGIRANLNKHRTLMLLRMRQVLTPDQRVKLNKLYEQWQKDHKNSNNK